MASISNARAAILKRFDVRSGKWIISGVLMAISTRQLGPSGASSRADLCKRGFAGGQVNGHQRDGRYGIFCFRRGAQWFDALDRDIAKTGWGFTTPFSTTIAAHRLQELRQAMSGKGFSGQIHEWSSNSRPIRCRVPEVINDASGKRGSRPPEPWSEALSGKHGCLCKPRQRC